MDFSCDFHRFSVIFNAFHYFFYRFLQSSKGYVGGFSLILHENIAKIMIFIILIDFHGISVIFMDFFNSKRFSCDCHWFLYFYEFSLIFIDFLSIFIIFKRLCGRIFMDFAWKVLQKLRFSCFSLIFIEFLRFLWILCDFPWIFHDFHGFPMIFHVFF